MKVRDLIMKLLELDQDKYIVISGYEGGCDFPNHASKVSIVLDQNTEWYYGKHEIEHNDDSIWNAYILMNKEDE